MNIHTRVHTHLLHTHTCTHKHVHTHPQRHPHAHREEGGVTPGTALAVLQGSGPWLQPPRP